MSEVLKELESSKTRDLFPIVLFAYNRPWHTLQVLQALSKNHLANQSKLTVFIDGPKENASVEDLQKIEEVKDVVIKEKWCKEVQVNIATKNQGCRNAPINGISKMLQNHEAVIVLEDDIITSPFFLDYMNVSLNYYKNYKSVFSVSAYNFPKKILPIPIDYEYDVYVSYRQLNWGWGTWKDRWEQVSWDKRDIPNFLSNVHMVNAFNRGGDDLSRMLMEEYNGISDAWDIQLSFAHFQNHALSIIPCNSYTNNIGLDSSGTHTINKQTEGFENNLTICLENPKLLSVLYTDKRIVNSFCSIFYSQKRPLWKKIINRTFRIIGRKSYFITKKKVFC